MMKKILFALVVAAVSNAVQAQNPVKWSFESKKRDTKTYEIHFIATIQSPWSIYSQTTPAGGPVPTSFFFNKNPLVSLEGKMNEIGSMKKKHEEVFGVDVYYYKEKVDFVQVIKLKAAVKTNISGTLEFMTCDDEQCLPPTSISFSIDLK